jgi:hypothetical protein
MNTFATVRAAFEALSSLPDAAIEGLQYEVQAVFDGDRSLVGYQVRITDLDGFGLMRDHEGKPTDGRGLREKVGDLEAIARLIDPSSWRVFDSELERVKRHHPNGGYDPDNFTDRASLAVADRIIDLIEMRMSAHR